ncbi:MAG: tetratricopeptide repeat protein [Thermodesulfobacteriota bacterium]
MSGEAALRRLRKPLVDFLDQDRGVFFVVSDDAAFVAEFEDMLLKGLLLPRERVRAAGDGADFFRQVRQPFFADKRLLLMVERRLAGGDVREFVRQARAYLDTCRVLVRTAQVDREVLTLLHEEGVDNFVARGAPAEVLLEKMAATVRPAGKLGQVLDQGRALVGRGRCEEALRLADKALELKPGSASALVLKGDALRGLARPEAARDAYLAAAEGAPMFLEPLKRLAELYREQGDRPRRLECLARLDALSPMNVRRKVELGALLLASGERERAVACFDAAVARVTEEAMGLIEEVRLSIADACQEKDPALAERYYRSVIEARKEGFRRSDVSVFNRLGLALRRQGRWAEAVAEYKKALQVAPGDEHLHFNVAVALAEGGEGASAAATLDWVLAKNPGFGEDSDVLSYQMGAILAASGRPVEARARLERALALNPGHEAALAMLRVV